MNLNKFYSRKSLPLIAGLLLLLLSASCDNPTPDTTEIHQERRAKDLFFATDKNSPIPDSSRSSFAGLQYFTPNDNLRFSGPIDVFTDRQIDTVATSRENDLRPALRYGYFKFTFQGNDHRLLVYKFLRSKPDYQNYLFLGFTDQTTGEETYGAGRYIDLVISPDNHYTVDFNLAYNPYCAYNSSYSCPIPPAENHLPFRVEAGEKNYHK